jgi:retron-type reverse transcriptase
MRQTLAKHDLQALKLRRSLLTSKPHSARSGEIPKTIQIKGKMGALNSPYLVDDAIYLLQRNIA